MAAAQLSLHPHTFSRPWLMLAYLITTTIYSGCAGSDDSKNAWAVLISHAHDQDVHLSTGQPLLLAWRIDLQAVLAKAERSGMDSSRTQTEALTFALVVDGELESMQHLSPSSDKFIDCFYHVNWDSYCSCLICD